MTTPAEQRALDYQSSQRRRKAFERFLQAALRAPQEPARTTKLNWKPLRRS